MKQREPIKVLENESERMSVGACESENAWYRER